MLRTTPFLLFDGNCAEAMRFYHACLGGELTLTKLGDTSMKDMFPPEKKDFKNSMICHLEPMANSTINLVSSGFSKEIKRNKKI